LFGKHEKGVSEQNAWEQQSYKAKQVSMHQGVGYECESMVRPVTGGMILHDTKNLSFLLKSVLGICDCRA
jgi:hypothetical protein